MSPPPVVRDWRTHDLTQEEREDLEERAALIADGCRVSQEEGFTRALAQLRERKAREKAR